jgi:acetylxylan esterase
MLSDTLKNALFAVLLSVGNIATAQLTPVSDWGDNPTGLSLDAYIPSSLPESPAVILALHGCGGSGSQYAQQTSYTSLADDGGFIVLYPSTPNNDNCWDVATVESLTHEGGGDSTGLVNMVEWAIANHNADPSKIFVTGSSSGCMMTNVLCGTYPDVFSAASCYSGIPAGCLKGSPGSSPGTADPACAAGQVHKSGEEWASIVKEMYPGYSGEYPKTMIWHGTADTFVNYPNLAETLKQWSAIFGISNTNNVTDSPLPGYTQLVYGDGSKLVGYSAEGVGHTVPVADEVDLRWFGLA